MKNPNRQEKYNDFAISSKSIGHSSVRTTMEIYAHLDMTQNCDDQHSGDELKDF